MQFQFNSDNQTPLGSDTASSMEALIRERFDRISDRLTRVEVHVSDVNGPRGGSDDKKCSIEIRPSGMKPITVSNQAATVEAAVSTAAAKALIAFDRQEGKQTTKKGH